MRNRIVLENLDPVDEEAANRAASDAVFDELLEQLVGDKTDLTELLLAEEASANITSQSVADDVQGPPSAKRWRTAAIARRGRIGVVVVGATAVLALVAGLLSALGSGMSPTTRPQSGGWHLTGYVTGWTVDANGPDMGALTCPDATTCYVTGPSGAVTAGLIPIDSLWVSNDAGAHWSGPHQLPAGMTFSSPLACSGKDKCIAGGQVAGSDGRATSGVVLETGDGGQTWNQHALPSGVGIVHTVSCPSSTSCFALANNAPGAYAAGIKPQYEANPQPGTLLSTTDGGRTWSASALPNDETIALLDCPNATSCVVAGESFAAAAGAAPTGVVLTTSDGGHTWRSSASSAAIWAPTALSCPTAENCFVVGSRSSTVPEPACTGGTGRAGLPCIRPPDGTRQVATSQFYRSTDGGLNWENVPFPSSPPDLNVDHLSCPTSSQCWISGEDGLPYAAVGPSGDGSSTSTPIVLYTGDAGATWSARTPPPERNAGNSVATLQVLAGLQCLASNDCVALALGGPPGRNSGLVFTYRNH